VTALKDQWQQQRQQRQQQLAQRQQQVRQMLAVFQQERQLKAEQLRDNLSLLQIERQHETHQFLTRVNQQRQIEAEYLTVLLSNFSLTLRSQTADFLTAKAADRSLMTQQLSQDLSHFRSQLNASVAALRTVLQTRVQSLQAETQTLLSASNRYRVRMRRQQVRDLSSFVVALQTQVQDYLVELELLRQERAQQLHHRLQQSHDRRLSDINALFQQLAEFRAELQRDRAALSRLVWGDAVDQPMAVEPQVDRLVGDRINSLPSDSQPICQSQILQSSVPSSTGSDAPTEILERVIPSLNIQSNSAQLEQVIYNYIYQAQGARLSEIESALGVNRFQSVDALRALIRRGLITQRDRIYLIQEEVRL
jgi:hypothetical protein